MLMQEMDGCDIGEDPDVDGVPTDSVETEVNVFVVSMNVQNAAYSCNLCRRCKSVATYLKLCP